MLAWLQHITVLPLHLLTALEQAWERLSPEDRQHVQQEITAGERKAQEWSAQGERMVREEEQYVADAERLVTDMEARIRTLERVYAEEDEQQANQSRMEHIFDDSSTAS